MPARDGDKDIEIQNRDVGLMLGLFESRVMTLAHAAALHFDGKAEMAKKRVQRLKSRGYIRERARRPNEPSILHLGQPGYELLRERGRLEDYPRIGWERLEKRLRVSAATLRHELDVMDFKSAFISAVRREPRLCVEFCTWPALISFEAYLPKGGRVLVRPDGFVRLSELGEDGTEYEQFFFLEVDRSSESLDTLVVKAQCYHDWYGRGGFAVRCGGSTEEFGAYPFRVLVTCRSDERRNNFAERLLSAQPKILHQLWMANQAAATEQPLGKVWITPADYRAAVRGTSFDLAVDVRSGSAYRREFGRESLVSEKIVMRSIID